LNVFPRCRLVDAFARFPWCPSKTVNAKVQIKIRQGKDAGKIFSFTEYDTFVFGWMDNYDSAQAKPVTPCYPPAMAALDYPHITRDADNVARLDRLPRIRIAQIAADHIGNGWSAEEIIRQYPHLTAAEVHAALATTTISASTPLPFPATT